MEIMFYVVMACFFVGCLSFGLFMGAANFFVGLHDKWKLEHDRRIRLERENIYLKKRLEAVEELYREGVKR